MSALQRFFLLLGLAFAVIQPASAATITYKATLTEGQEVSPTGSGGTGALSLMYDSSTYLLSLNLTFAGLTGLTTAAHIHAAPAGVNGQIMTPAFLPGLPVNVTSGTMSTMLDLTSAASFSAAFITASGGTIDLAREALLARLDAGTAYFNLHTTAFPAGEIRGQIYRDASVSPVPLPAGLSLSLAGLAALVFVRRRT